MSGVTWTQKVDGEGQNTGRAYSLGITNGATNNGNVSGTNYAGGAVGTVDSGVTVINVDKFVNIGAISGKHVAGVVGKSNYEIKVTVTNTKNFGAITGADGGNVGGFVGQMAGTADKDANESTTITVENCYNGGVISGGTNNGSVIGNIASDAAVLSVSGVILTASTDLEVVAVSETAVTPTNVVKLAADDFKVLEGARIRLSQDDETQNGLRFDIAAKGAVDKLVAGGFTGLKMGSLMAKAENVTDEFTADALDAAEKKYSDASADYAAEFLKADGTYSAALKNFAPEQYSTKYACVGYITVTLGTTTVTIYTAYDSNNTRSIEEVAEGVLGDPNPGFDYSAYQTVLDAFAAGAPAAQ